MEIARYGHLGYASLMMMITRCLATHGLIKVCPSLPIIMLPRSSWLLGLSSSMARNRRVWPSAPPPLSPDYFYGTFKLFILHFSFLFVLLVCCICMMYVFLCCILCIINNNNNNIFPYSSMILTETAVNRDLRSTIVARRKNCINYSLTNHI